MTPCSLKNKPHALHNSLLSLVFRHNGVVVVKQFSQMGCDELRVDIESIFVTCGATGGAFDVKCCNCMKSGDVEIVIGVALLLKLKVFIDDTDPCLMVSVSPFEPFIENSRLLI